VEQDDFAGESGLAFFAMDRLDLLADGLGHSLDLLGLDHDAGQGFEILTGHLGGLQVTWGLLSAYDPTDQAVDFPGDLRLDERAEVFFPSNRAVASSGSGRAAQIASLTAMSLSLRARNSL
jgi:hypothetical protein